MGIQRTVNKEDVELKSMPSAMTARNLNLHVLETFIYSARLSSLHHQKSSSSLTAGDDLEGRIAAHPCSAEYAALEVCLGEHDRSWAVCRTAVLALRACDSKVKASSLNVESSSESFVIKAIALCGRGIRPVVGN